MDWTAPDPPKKPDLYVVARFLDRLGEAGGSIPRTKLQGAVRLNYDLYRSYLSLLVRKGFVVVETDNEHDKEPGNVRLTKLGLDARAQLVGWIRDAFGDIRL